MQLLDEKMLDVTESENHERQKQRHRVHRRCNRRVRYPQSTPAKRTEPTKKYGRGRDFWRRYHNKQSRINRYELMDELKMDDIVVYQPSDESFHDSIPDNGDGGEGILDIDDELDELFGQQVIDDRHDGWMMHEFVPA